DKGLCGALNSRLIKGLFQSELRLNTPAEDRILVTIGKKSMDYAKYNNIPVDTSFNWVSANMSSLEALDLIDAILDYWEKKKVKQIVMAAADYKMSLVFYPVVETFLPFSLEMIEEHLNAEALAEGLDSVTEEDS